MRIILMLAGLVCVGLGIIGIILPVFPGTVFFLAAAVLFARSNPKWEAKIMEHPYLGPPIRAYRERGVIPNLAKLAAIGSMAVTVVVSYIALDGAWRYVPAVICLLCGLYIVTRPSR